MRELKVVVAASHRLAPGLIAMHLLQQLASLPLNTRVAMRSPLHGQPGPVEVLTYQLCESLKIPVDWYLPKPGTGSTGTIDRDYRMVSGSSLVLAYFHPDHVMDPDTGTGRVAKIALETGHPVEAYEPTKESVREVGAA